MDKINNVSIDDKGFLKNFIMANDKLGPSVVNVPATSYTTCNGCKFLDKTPGIRGRKKVTNNYNCAHEDAPKLNFNIGNHVEGDPIPPQFCPFKQ